jgi:hypothetical protein
MHRIRITRSASHARSYRPASHRVLFDVGLAQITDFCPFRLSGLQSHSLPEESPFLLAAAKKSFGAVTLFRARLRLRLQYIVYSVAWQREIVSQEAQGPGVTIRVLGSP